MSNLKDMRPYPKDGTIEEKKEWEQEYDHHMMASSGLFANCPYCGRSFKQE